MRASDEPFSGLFDTLLGGPPPSPVGRFILHQDSLGDMEDVRYSSFPLTVNEI